MGKWTLHRKVKAAVIAAVIVIITDGATQLAGLYPNNAFVNELQIAIPVIIAYLTKAESE